MQFSPQILYNKTLSGVSNTGVSSYLTKNVSAIATQTNYIAMNDNPIFLRGTVADGNHYLVYGNVAGNSFAGLSTDGPALVGYGAGVLGTSSGGANWSLRWDSSNSVYTNGQLNTNALYVNTTLTTVGVINANGSSSATYTYGFLNSSGTTGTATNTGTYSVLAANRVKASEFNAVSSKKIKTITGQLTDSVVMAEALALFKSIPLSRYKYTDLTQHDNYVHYGLIAENMPNGIYTDATQSGFVPNVYSLGTVSNVDSSGVLTIGLISPISADKLSTITTLNDVLCYFSMDSGATFSNIKILNNITITDASNITLYASDFTSFNYSGATFLIFGTQETIPNITKNNYMELASCIVQNLLARVEKLEHP